MAARRRAHAAGLMLGDALHTAFLTDFVVVYLRAISSQGLGSVLSGTDVRLAGGMSEAV